MGAQGPVGEIVHWTEYRDFTFDNGTANIQVADGNKASEIARYLASNPSLQLDIDGTMDPRDINLSGPRIDAVHAALMQAGVPNSSMRHGAANDPQFTHDGRVEILISTR
jgi:outer membrane protein OmpA-like peptidoglycan-associated protein